MKRITAILLVLVMLLALSACGTVIDESTINHMYNTVYDIQEQIDILSERIDAQLEAAEQAAAKAAEEAAAAAAAKAEEEAAAAARKAVLDAADHELPVNAMVLNGTTGFSMAKLIHDAQNGSAALNYAFSVETDASNISAALISGDCDIAALPTNAAATLYNRTEGGVQLAAINTLGVLYLVENTESVSVEAMSDLEGMTVYAPAQNPTILFNIMANAAGVDVAVDNTYAQPADLRTAIAAGEVDLAVLPEPMVTIALSANESLAVALDLTSVWDSLETPGSLVQGCIVFRTAFVREHPAEAAAFLAEYADSVAYLTDDPAGAAQCIEETGIFPQAAVAQKAIPNCNICLITGQEMKDAMNRFAEILYAANPDAVGGAVPGDDFYYLG
mgnify:CR=1 FL=1